MNHLYKVAFAFLFAGIAGVAGMLIGSAPAALAAEVTVQDGDFTLYNGAEVVSDGTASDGYAANMPNNTTGWNIQLRETDFGFLQAGTSYDVFVRIKVDLLSATPTGNAFKIGVYDYTYGGPLLNEKAVAASSMQDMVWKEVKIGTFQPNAGVNELGIYVAGTNNAAQVSEIYVDSLVFKEYAPYVIEDSDFILWNGAALTADGLTSDNSSARMANGSSGHWNIHAPVDPDNIEAGVLYDINVYVKPERTDWTTSSGDMFGIVMYDTTSSSYVINHTVYSTTTPGVAAKTDTYYNVAVTGTNPVELNPSHNIYLAAYQVDNAADFPYFRVDKVVIAKDTVDDTLSQAISAYPYKISPANTDDLNDTTAITYELPGSSTTYVRVYNAGGSLVKTIVDGVVQSGTQTVEWNGKNNSNQIVTNGLYTVKVNHGGADILKKNIQVISGVTVTPPDPIANDYFPLGVYFDGAHIPYNVADAEDYLDLTFSDIQAAGADTVIISVSLFGRTTSNTIAILDKAEEYDLNIIMLPEAHRSTIMNEGLYNDEVAMYDRLSQLIAPWKDHEALLGYALYDEPARADVKLADNLADMQRMLETIDPDHLVKITLNSPDGAELHYGKQKSQAIVADPYGAFHGYGVGDFTHMFKLPYYTYEQMLDQLTLQVRKDIDNPAPSWNILQAVGWTTWLRDPTPAEMRAMTYEAIGRGTKGVFYFIYQSMIDWTGMVDYDYNHTVKYTTIQSLFTEITSMKTTIRNMTRIANAASATGGGNSAYDSADVTTHVDYTTGDKYLVVVNHDCEDPQNITISIDRAKLGMDITAIQNVYDSANISFTANSTHYTISNLSFAAGAGKILKLVKSTSMDVYTGQDDLFTVYNGATKNNADVSSSDAGSALRVLETTNGWDIQWFWDKAELTPAATYDLYAVVKIKYADDLVVDGIFYTPYVPSGNAFSYGVYDVTASNWVVSTTAVAASSMENMLWHTIKIGTFVPSQTNSQYVYIYPQDNNTDDVYAVYVDKFYFVKQ